MQAIKRRGVANVVWVTADVHYTAAHRYDPNHAVFQDFSPFWEFVPGPLNAGTFGPNGIDPAVWELAGGTRTPNLLFTRQRGTVRRVLAGAVLAARVR
jgi:phosphodiesterase/alkaline phosphatase D-like protein